jgi:hypothetical protein
MHTEAASVSPPLACERTNADLWIGSHSVEAAYAVIAESLKAFLLLSGLSERV